MGALLKRYPNPLRLGNDALREWAAHQGHALDPDQTDVVVLHYQLTPNLDYQAIVTQRMSLGEAMLRNWQGESSVDVLGKLFNAPWAGRLPAGPIRLVQRLRELGPLESGDPYQVFNGLFRRCDPPRYDDSTHLPVDAQALQAFIWHYDLHRRYTEALQRFWREQLHPYRIATKISFLAACNKQVSEGSLSERAKRMVWRAAGVLNDGTPVTTRLLNIYGYGASDILYFTDPTSEVVLYIPGNSSPFHTFAQMGELQDWVALQCRDAAKRKALQSHFSLADRPDGLDFSGLDTALEGLAAYPAPNHLPPEHAGFTHDGFWYPQTYVNYRAEHYNQVLPGDVFESLVKHQRARSMADIDCLVVSKGEVNKARWLGYLQASMDILAPLSLLLPEVGLLIAAAGVAEFGLGLDQVATAPTEVQRADAVGTCVFGLLNAAPMLGATLSEARLLRVRRGRFVSLRKVNGQLGYPASPLSPPRLPYADVAPYFEFPNAVHALADADEAVSQNVQRLCAMSDDYDTLQASIGGYLHKVRYDLQADAFVQEDDFLLEDPPLYVAEVGRRDLVPVGARTRAVTDLSRHRTLRALGIDLPLPLTLPPLQDIGATPIPRQLFSLWVGDQPLPEALLHNLVRNHQRLRGSAYRLRVYLSGANPDAYADNLRRILRQAPDMELLQLEAQPSFVGFRDSPYYAHYQAAVDGNGGVACNFSSASDVLRYWILYEEGGLYMDMDDSLRTPGLDAPADSAQALDPDAQPIDTLALHASPTGLLLPPPMSNEQLGMFFEYNTSLIGSHPGNPTLRAISEEMRARFAADPTLYDAKPNLQTEPAAFHAYAKRLSALTGPGMLNAVIARELPELYRLRQVFNLQAIKVRNGLRTADYSRFLDLLRTRLPLDRVAVTGSFHSWSRT